MIFIEESVTFAPRVAIWTLKEKYGVDVHVPSTSGVWMGWITGCRGSTQYGRQTVILDQAKEEVLDADRVEFESTHRSLVCER